MANKKRIREFVSDFLDFKLYDYQMDFIVDCFEKKYVLGCWSRQIGKSTSTALFACLYAALNENKTVIIIAHSDRQSKELYRKVLNFIHRLAPFKQLLKKETQEETLFSNGSRILNLPTGDDGSYIRGYTADCVILDECAFIPDTVVDEVITPFLATTGGKMIKLSTPRGKVGHFYQSFNDPDYAVHHYDYSYGIHAGLLNKEFIDKKRKDMDSFSFSQEYEALFVEETSSYFGSKLINQSVDTSIALLSKVSSIASGSFFLGFDPSRFGTDNAVAVVVKRGNKEIPHKVVFVDSIPKSTLDFQGNFIKRLDEQFKFSKIFIDETGLGSGLKDYLAKSMNYGRMEKVQGITFTNKSKKDIYSHLRTLLENRKLVLPNHQELLLQLKDLQYEYTNSGNLRIYHPPNRHDDYPDALALACQGLKNSESAWFITNSGTGEILSSSF